MFKIIFIIYKIIYFFIYLILKALRPVLSPSVQKWIDLRESASHKSHELLKLASCDKKNQNALSKRALYWFHASSGEIEYVKPLIRNLKKSALTQKSETQIQILVTYSSASAEKLFSNIQDDVDLFLPLPWDLKTSLAPLFDILKPKALIFARTDFWPELIYLAHDYKVPLFAISVFPRQSFLSLYFFKKLVQNFNFISSSFESLIKDLQFNTSAELYLSIESRFAQVIHRLKSPSLISMTSTHTMICFGSTWPEDEKQLFPVLTSLCQKLINQKIKLIWAPHDVSRAKELFEKINVVISENLSHNLDQKLRIHFLSESVQKSTPHSVQISADDFDLLIVDQVGYLADFYRLTYLSFIGGSYVKKVHSVMEPLCASNLVLTGPLIQNSPEALSFSKSKELTVCQNSNELVSQIQKLLHQKETQLDHTSRLDLNQIERKVHNDLQYILNALLKLS